MLYSLQSIAKYDPSQPRDEQGQWTTTGRTTPGLNLTDLIFQSGVGSDHVHELYGDDPEDAFATNFNLSTVRAGDIERAKAEVKARSQAQLRQEKGEEVLAYRGVTGTEGKWDTVSLTLSPHTAKHHATRWDTKEVGEVREYRIKTGDVLSYSEAVGRGTFDELEIIVPVTSTEAPLRITEYVAKPATEAGRKVYEAKVRNFIAKYDPIYEPLVRKFEEALHPRDAHGRFTEKATIRVEGREIQIVKPLRAALAGDQLVPLSLAAFDPVFQQDPGFYLGAGGAGGIGTRYQRFGAFISQESSIEAPEVYVQADGRVGFINGRHRYAWLRDQGLTLIPVAMTPESVKHAKQYGYLAAIKRDWDESKHPRDEEGQFTTRGLGLRQNIGLISPEGKDYVGDAEHDHTDLAREIFDDDEASVNDALNAGFVRYWIHRNELALNFAAGSPNASENALQFVEDYAEEGKQIYLDIVGGDDLGHFFSTIREANVAIRAAAKRPKSGWLQRIARLPKVAQEHSFGNTQIQIAPTSRAAASLNAARDAIRDEDCMGTGKDVDPNHVTVRFGLLPGTDVTRLRTFLSEQQAFEAELGPIELFPVSEHSDGAVPVVARIVSPELVALEEAIGRYATFKEKNFPEYKPHCTLAYVHPERAAEYATLPVQGRFVVQSVTISHASGVKETIPFGRTQKWNPSQPRDTRGRWVELGLHGDQVTLLHGTTRSNAGKILAEGFKSGNPSAVAASIEKEYQLPEGSIAQHVAFQFAKGRRDLDEVHFTTDESVADQYSVPEVLQDALTSAHMLLHPTPEDVPFTKERHVERKVWIDREAKRLTEPAVLAITVPFSIVGQHGFGKVLTLEEFKAIQAKFPGDETFFNNVRLPISALKQAKIQRWKRESFHNRPRWQEARHPRQPKGSSRGGEFMAVLHGPRDALESLLNKETDVNIDRGDVRRFLELAGEQHEDPDLTDLQVEGTALFGKDGLGIKREDMPQIPRDHRRQFLHTLAKEGVTITEEKVEPLTLKPTQSEISARRVAEKMIKYEEKPKPFPPVLVSEEGRILDGHHHWGMMAAFALDIPAAKMPIYRLHLSTKQALARMHAYMKRHGIRREGLSGAAVKADPAGRYVTPFVSFEKQGDEQLRMIASLNSSRLATWGFTAEAEVLGMARYKLTAVLDGRTSKFCRMIDGKIFDVPEARRKVIEVLNVQNPEDLKQVQPWPKQDTVSMALYAAMTPTELVERGLHIPPYHPHCRTILRHVPSSVGKATEPPIPTVPTETEVFTPVTAADLKEVGVEATPQQVAEWNDHIGMSPTELLSKLTSMPPQEILTKGQGVGATPVYFDPYGNLGLKAHGETPKGVEFKLGAILDPFTGIFYLSEAQLLAGTPQAELAFLKNLFKEMIAIGTKMPAATSLAVNVAGNAPYYAKLGFRPDELEWDALRTYAQEAEAVQTALATLASADRKLVMDLLADGSPTALTALAELPFTYRGQTIGEWILGETTGIWRLDLEDAALVSHAREFLS